MGVSIDIGGIGMEDYALYVFVAVDSEGSKEVYDEIRVAYTVERRSRVSSKVVLQCQ